MKILGVTGGIACGKSFVTALLAGWGAQTASADADARAVVAPDSALLRTVLATFPESRSPDGSLDRKRLGEITFADPDARTRLETLLHPAIFERMAVAINAARVANGAPLFVYEVPLLFEKNRESLFDSTLAVVCSPEAQATRLNERETNAGRPAFSPEQIATRLAAQLPNDEKVRRADFVIRTDGVIADTRRQARAVWLALTGSEPAQTGV